MLRSTAPSSATIQRCESPHPRCCCANQCVAARCARQPPPVAVPYFFFLTVWHRVHFLRYGGAVQSSNHFKPLRVYASHFHNNYAIMGAAVLVQQAPLSLWDCYVTPLLVL